MIQQCKYELFADKSLHIQGWAVMEAAGYRLVVHHINYKEPPIMA